MFPFDGERIKEQARILGFNRVGLARAAPSPQLNAYFRWLEANYHGTMGYMSRADRIARRRDLNVILPGVQTLILVGLDYRTLTLPVDVANDPRRGRIAAYAWGADYHDTLIAHLQTLADWLQTASGKQAACRVYVDTGAILERSHAQQAGLGFVGKNTMLIDPRGGSYFFLGEILTDLEMDSYDSPARETQCGSCQRCLAACPTNAFPQPYTLDARRCISYLTIESKGVIDHELRPLMGNWVFGCDVCQNVCPWNRFAIQTREPAFYPLDVDRAAPPLADLLMLDDATFRARFDGSAVLRIGRDRLVRNACLAARNSGVAEFAPVLDQLARADRSELVREAAEWARSRLPTP
ncbi:MAG: tRNA epoxyqueuosine(34) reductase QueG [Aggregatilineales bacterium]